MNYTLTSYYLDKPLVVGRVFDVMVPEKITQDTALFIVHGGGWRAGSRTSYHNIMEAFCDLGYVVASTDYRLDAKDAFEQLKDIRESYDNYVTILKNMGRPLNIAVHGSSAGAHLSSLLVCANPGECGEEAVLKNEWVKPIKAMLQATPTDFLPYEAIMPHFWATMQGIAGVPYDKDPDVYERLSLKNYVRRDNPPIFFMEAEREHIFASKHTKKLVEQHNKMGIKSTWKMYPDVEHGFFFALTRQAQKEAFSDILAFLDDTLKV